MTKRLVSLWTCKGLVPCLSVPHMVPHMVLHMNLLLINNWNF